MAGIGFKLQKIISEQHLQGSAGAYMASAAVSTGPWILMALGITFLAGGQLWLGSGTSNADFRVLATHAFAFSQIIAGSVQLVVTRYLADRLYEEDDDALFPVWTSSSLLCILLCVGVGFGGAKLAGLSDLNILQYSLLLGLLGLLWNSASFLSMLRDYNRVLLAYFLGALCCIGAAITRPLQNELNWILGGLCLGIGITVLLIVTRILAEFKLSARGSWEILRAFRQYFWLLLMGFSYGLGVWIDKFIFWWMDDTGFAVLPYFHNSSIYDAAVFWSLISVIPSYAVFLMHTETDFYSSYRDFFGAISHRRPYREINQHKQMMKQVIQNNVRKLFYAQGLVTTLFLVIPILFPNRFGLSPDILHIYQILLIGTMLQVFFFFLNIILQYLDFIKYSALLTLGFCLLNALFTWISIRFTDLSWYGYGYFLAALCLLTITWFVLQKLINQLEFHTFMGSKSRL